VVDLTTIPDAAACERCLTERGAAAESGTQVGGDVALDVAKDARTVVVTGAGSGIGAAAALALAKRGDRVVLVGRRRGKVERVGQRVARATGMVPPIHTVDFAELAQVRRLAAELASAYPRIDVLANNAGMLGGLRRETVDRHELTMQVNHLAPFLLTWLLLDQLRAAAAAAGHARVIATASLAEAWGYVEPADLDGRKIPVHSRWLAYGSAKKAVVVCTHEAAQRLAGTGIVPSCFHPGLVRTAFANRTSLSFNFGKLVPLGYVSAAAGADTLVHLATSPDGLAHPGGYFYRRRLQEPVPLPDGDEQASQIFEASAAAVGAPVPPRAPRA